MSKGKAFKYGDDVNTDVIFPGKYTYTLSDPKEIAAVAMEDIDPEFSSTVKKGDIIVAGKNFGCGSSREQAAFCLKYAGVAAVVAKSFSRIFYRNAINAGLPMVVNKEAPDAIEYGDEVSINFEKGILIAADGTEFTFPPLPDDVLGIIEAGGLVEYVKRELG
ncbi:MAG: 3-isopropylmalate dehydratase small subunit [bacterium]|nr:3-isopropylmalate dehydratase small subunit [bacterium]